MSDYPLPRASAAEPFRNRLAEIIFRLLRFRRSRRRDIRALSSLTDSMLRDVGVTRDEIEFTEYDPFAELPSRSTRPML